MVLDDVVIVENFSLWLASELQTNDPVHNCSNVHCSGNICAINCTVCTCTLHCY